MYGKTKDGILFFMGYSSMPCPRRVALGYGIIGRILGKILWLQYCFPQAFVYKELHSLHMQKSTSRDALHFSSDFLQKGMIYTHVIYCAFLTHISLLLVFYQSKKDYVICRILNGKEGSV